MLKKIQNRLAGPAARMALAGPLIVVSVVGAIGISLWRSDGGFDVVSCRNVLIYFDPPTVERVVRLLESALTPGGMLILGAADRLSGRFVRSGRPPAEKPARRGGNYCPEFSRRPATPTRGAGHIGARSDRSTLRG